jgi:hypothetical protein
MHPLKAERVLPIVSSSSYDAAGVASREEREASPQYLCLEHARQPRGGECEGDYDKWRSDGADMKAGRK